MQPFFLGLEQQGVFAKHAGYRFFGHPPRKLTIKLLLELDESDAGTEEWWWEKGLLQQAGLWDQAQDQGRSGSDELWKGGSLLKITRDNDFSLMSIWWTRFRCPRAIIPRACWQPQPFHPFEINLTAPWRATWSGWCDVDSSEQRHPVAIASPCGRSPFFRPCVTRFRPLSRPCLSRKRRQQWLTMTDADRCSWEWEAVRCASAWNGGCSLCWWGYCGHSERHWGAAEGCGRAAALMGSMGALL